MPPIDERLTRLEQIVKNIESIVHGPPPIDDRWRAYADARDEHKARNAEQDAQDIREELDRQTAKNDRRHESNDARLRKLEQLAWGIMGVQMLLKLIPGELIMKMLGGH